MQLPPSLRDRYEPSGTLGEGGFGAVLRCRDLRLGREVALKLLSLEDDAEATARFEREARVTAALRHPNVVQVYDHGVADGLPWIAYELIPGQDLDGWVRTHGLPGPEVLAAWATQGSSALGTAHQAGLVHRDVKPANFLVRAEDQGLVLVDFGITRPTAPRPETLRTKAGVILGTPGYMAPELFHGSSPSPASDQWAFAAVLAELLTGRPPYGTHDLNEVFAASRTFRPGDDVTPGPAGPTLRRALHADPTRRFPDMAALGAALAGVELSVPALPNPDATVALAGVSKVGGPATTPLAAPAPPALEPPAPGPGRRGLLAAAGLALLVGAFLVRPTPTTPPEPSEPPAPPTTSPAPQLEKLTQRVRVGEEKLRTRVTQGASRKAWSLDVSAWNLPEDQSRLRARNIFHDHGLADDWSSLAVDLANWLVAVDALPPEDRVTRAPEVYQKLELVGFVASLRGRAQSLLSEQGQDMIGRGNLGAAFQQTRDIEEVRLRVEESVARLAERLLGHPGGSPELRQTARLLQIITNQGNVSEVLQDLIGQLPTGRLAMDKEGPLILANHLLFARNFGPSENPEALDYEQRCDLLPRVLPDLVALVDGIPVRTWRVEYLMRLLVLEVDVPSNCEREAPGLTDRVRALVDRTIQERAPLDASPAGIPGKLENLDDRLRVLVRRKHPDAEALTALIGRLAGITAPGRLDPATFATDGIE
jgi:serine/threonine protein kinase